jgi:hypothetical protein
MNVLERQVISPRRAIVLYFQTVLGKWDRSKPIAEQRGCRAEPRSSLRGTTSAPLLGQVGFAEPFRRAGAAALRRTVQAGESSGPEGVRDAIELLGADRVDHPRTRKGPTVVLDLPPFVPGVAQGPQEAAGRRATVSAPRRHASRPAGDDPSPAS